PSQIKPPAKNQACILGSIVENNGRPNHKNTNIKLPAITTKLMSHFERPIFPASYHNVGTVPKIAPIKNHRATLSISPSIKLIKNDSKKIPITAPIPTGIKKRTFALKFFNG